MASFSVLARTALHTAPRQHASTAALLGPFFSHLQQCRHASVLSSLSDNSGAYSKRIRRGRGPASGKGKTSGRGHKGQKQHGKVPAGFNGGQTPDIVVSGRRGFENPFSVDLAELNVTRIAKWIANGRINPAQPITVVELVRSGCISSPKDGVKLLAKADALTPLTLPITIVVSRASQQAISAIEAAGGQVVTRYYSPSSLKRVMAREVHPYYSLQSRPIAPSDAPADPTALALAAAADPPSGGTNTHPAVLAEILRYRYRLADASRRKDIEYYRDEARRGYLAHTVESGRGPSLFFAPPRSYIGQNKAKASAVKAKATAANRLW